jgi:hypothetical protein
MKKIIELPEWFALANENAVFTAKDVAELFDFSVSKSKSTAVYKSSFPKPDGVIHCSGLFRGKRRKGRNTWSKKLLLKEIERRNNG